jgi:hypothetical protein
MGYACPVCEVPQQDAEHLANHLAFTALLHEDDHADWLDESVPDWREGGPEDLAPQVADLAEESDYDAVFEDTTGDHATHDHRHGEQGHDLGVDPATAGSQVGDELDAEAQSVLEEARAMTREMVAPADGEEQAPDGDDAAHTGGEAADDDADGNS